MFKTVTFALLLASLALVSAAQAGQVGLSLEDNTTLSLEDNTTLSLENNTTLSLGSDSSTETTEVATEDSWSLFDVPMAD